MSDVFTRKWIADNPQFYDTIARATARATDNLLHLYGLTHLGNTTDGSFNSRGTYHHEGGATIVTLEKFGGSSGVMIAGRPQAQEVALSALEELSKCKLQPYQG